MGTSRAWWKRFVEKVSFELETTSSCIRVGHVSESLVTMSATLAGSDLIKTWGQVVVSMCTVHIIRVTLSVLLIGRHVDV